VTIPNGSSGSNGSNGSKEPKGSDGPAGQFGDDGQPVRPQGGVIRKLRHERGWSPRALIDAVAEASRTATGIARTLTPNDLARIEDHDEPVPYEVLCLLADGFDCDPIDLLGTPRSEDEEEP
jgi:hypothetical protein